MARHRAPADDPWTREERPGGAVAAARLSWPAPRQERPARWSTPGEEPTERVPSPQPGLWGDTPPARRDRSPNSSGVLGRPTVVGVARVPVTSRLTPPGRQVRNQGPRPISTGRPVVVPASGGRHRRAVDPGR
ncbi:hypothetical protein ACLQ2S_20220 [Micromonospora sp. DT48]|uniref:hypothetical protein n=1 Tax=Micromonospora sp. DT48 TaxID=3393429 RepID=UPI003CF2D3D3